MRTLLFLSAFILGLSSCIKVEERYCDGVVSMPNISPSHLTLNVGESFNAYVLNSNPIYLYTWYDPTGFERTGQNFEVMVSSEAQSGIWKVKASLPGKGCESGFANLTVNATYVSPNCNPVADQFVVDNVTSYAMTRYSSGPIYDFYVVQWNHPNGYLAIHFKQAPQANHVYQSVNSFTDGGSLAPDEFTMDFKVGSYFYYTYNKELIYIEEYNGHLYVKFCSLNMYQSGVTHTVTTNLPLN